MSYREDFGSFVGNLATTPARFELEAMGVPLPQMQWTQPSATGSFVQKTIPHDRITPQQQR